MYRGGVYNHGIWYQGARSAGTAVPGWSTVRAVTKCNFGLLGGRGWTEPAKENQTGSAGPGVSLVPRSNPGHTLLSCAPSVLSLGVAVGFLPVFPFWLSVPGLSSVSDRFGFTALVSLGRHPGIQSR